MEVKWSQGEYRESRGSMGVQGSQGIQGEEKGNQGESRGVKRSQGSQVSQGQSRAVKGNQGKQSGLNLEFQEKWEEFSLWKCKAKDDYFPINCKLIIYYKTDTLGQNWVDLAVKSSCVDVIMNQWPNVLFTLFDYLFNSLFIAPMF